MRRHLISPILFIFIAVTSNQAQVSALKAQVDQMADAMQPKAIEWRHHLHQYPELSNREFKTAAYVEAHLRKLGLEVHTQVAHTGVVGILRGDKPGPVIALRADMDGLPVKERVDLPYASKERGVYVGDSVDVMHACGHDMHVSILMSAATILTSMKSSLSGTIVFIFQPSEEQAPPGEEGGAELMVKEGVLDNPKAEVIFGLHMSSSLEVGKIRYKPGSALAAVNSFEMTVHGKQTHGSAPWLGVDPIVTSAQIIMGLQTIVSRQMELTKEPVVISVGKITGGVRSNIIPEEVKMVGTIRTLDTAMQRIVHEKIRNTAINIAESMGATVDIKIDKGYPVTYNDLELTRKMLPTIFEAAGGEQNVILMKPSTGAEDFSFFAREIPGLFIFLGGMKPGTNTAEAPPHHTPDFRVEDEAMPLGIKTMCYLALDYMDAARR
ncbi:MAG: amidohydrolase [Saprospiraceae bacterium]|nr:amidohydrolase [Candidatus Opimibacter iunctus]